MSQLKKEILIIMYDWCYEMFDEFKKSTAPIIISNQIQNLQLLAKTLILFLQRCFPKSDSSSVDNGYSFENFTLLIKQILNDNGI